MTRAVCNCLSFSLGAVCVALATLAVMSVMAGKAVRRERRLQRLAIQRWEDEGGNLYVVAGVSPARRRGQE